MAMSLKLLNIIGRHLPAVFDVIPRGPLALRALNPQPLPPLMLGAAIAGEFAHTAWQDHHAGLDPGRAYAELEHWCPVGKATLKLPPWWPPQPDPEPVPHPNWAVNFHLGFAARPAVVAVDFEGTKFGESLGKAIARSVAVVESESR